MDGMQQHLYLHLWPQYPGRRSHRLLLHLLGLWPWQLTAAQKTTRICPPPPGAGLLMFWLNT